MEVTPEVPALEFPKQNLAVFFAACFLNSSLSAGCPLESGVHELLQPLQSF